MAAAAAQRVAKVVGLSMLLICMLLAGPDEHAVLLTRDYEQLLMQSAQAQACSARAMPPPGTAVGC